MVSLVLGPLDVLLHKVHRLLEFFILLGVGLHPLYQLAPLLGSPSYPLHKRKIMKKNNLQCER